jgi:hypothetical protein
MRRHASLIQLVLVAVIGAITQTALAQTVIEKPVAPEVGDWWASVFPGGREGKWTVTKVKDGVVTFLSTPSNTSPTETVDGNTIEYHTARGFGWNDPYLPNLQFPLQPGKTWKQSYWVTFKPKDTSQEFRFQEETEATVGAVERIKIAAGEFEAIKITYKFRNQNSTGTWECWYAPAVRRLAKCVAPDQRRPSFEVSSFKVGGETPTPSTK